MFSRLFRWQSAGRITFGVLSVVLALLGDHRSRVAGADPTMSDILATTQQLEAQRPEPTNPIDLQPKHLPSTADNQVSFAIPITYQPSTQTDSSSATAPTVEQQIQQLGAGIEELKGGEQQLATGEQQLKSGMQDLASNLRVTTLDPNIKIGVFGFLRGEMLVSDVRPVIPSAPFFLSPDTGLDQSTVDIHGKSTALGMAVEGPDFCGYKTGGLVLIYFFGQQVFANTSGVFFAQGFGELKSDVDRLAFGVQSDVFNPVNPTVLDWGDYLGAGNTGFLRGQLRYERYFKPSPDVQWTVTGALSNPVPTELFTFENPALIESNGWPNVEGRVAVGYGEPYQDGLVKRRPIEIGVSGVVGEIRTTRVVGLTEDRIVDQVWGAGLDAQVNVTDGFGFRGELYTGQGLATYGGAIMQLLGLTTFQTIRSSGGWIEVFDYLTPCLHTHWGYGVDDPVNGDVSLGQRTLNQAIFGNLIWDVTKQFQVGFEVTHWQTDYKALPASFVLGNNEGMDYHLRLQYAF